MILFCTALEFEALVEQFPTWLQSCGRYKNVEVCSPHVSSMPKVRDDRHTPPKPLGVPSVFLCRSLSVCDRGMTSSTSSVVSGVNPE